MIELLRRRCRCDMPIEVLLGKPPRMRREVRSASPPRLRAVDLPAIELREALYRVLRLPRWPTRPS